MKYGQQFAEELSGTSAEVQQASIDYKQLKKSIKRVENELQALGLSAQVLKELLNAGHDAPAAQAAASEAQSSDNDEIPIKRSGSSISLKRRLAQKQRSDKKKRKQARARAEYELAGTVEHPIPRIKLVFSSASSGSESSTEEDSLSSALYDRVVNNDHARIVELEEDAEEEEEVSGIEADARTIRSLKRLSNGWQRQPQDEEDEEAEKDLLMDALYGRKTVPQDRITPPSSPGRSNGRTPALLSSLEQESSTDDDNGIVHGPDFLLQQLSLDDQDGGEPHTVPIPVSPVRSTGSRPSSLRKKRRKPRRPRREVVINLEYDSEFFLLLNQALQSLTTLMDVEKASFKEAVLQLSRTVAATTSSAKNDKDMYAWREVFTLWVEAEIFESTSERSRGERPVAEVEKRLNWFVDQVGRRKLAKKMKSKESRKALERFVELNQELLQLKRIGHANQEAARKILKKHDKRLGLSASQDFPDFVAAHQQQIAGGEAPSANGGTIVARSAVARRVQSNEMTTLVFAGIATLPHVLLTMFTDTLLPVIPSLDDYACLICGDIAWRPIALKCGHHFCVRCLVKMQKRAQDACPACRAPVVLQANKENLDTALMTFQKQWFPREIKQKTKDDKKEIEKEIADELELAGKCIVS